MYRWVRTARIKAGKGAEARQWAKATADLLNERYPGHALEAHIEYFGAGNTIHWTSTSADLSDLETYINQTNADEAYQALAGKFWDYFVEGSVHDTLMRSV